MHQQQLSVEAGVKGGWWRLEGFERRRVRGYHCGGGLQALLLQAHAQEDIIDGEEVQGVGGVAGRSRESGQ